MSDERVDTRPLRSAAQAQTGVVVAGALGSGAGGGLGLAYLASLSTFGIEVGRVDLLIAFALSAVGAAGPSAVAQLVALARTVRQGERDTTPWRDAMDDEGRALFAHTDGMLDRALRELADRRAADDQAPPADPPRKRTRAGPGGTSMYPAVESARSMVAPGQRTRPPGGTPSADPPDYASFAADGPPSKQVHDGDWTGDRARAYDEGRAAERGRGPRVQTGPEVADRADRRSAARPARHEQRGGH